jgi:hypothetical protein
VDRCQTMGLFKAGGWQRHRLDSRAGSRPRHHPAGVRQQCAAPSPEQPGHHRPGRVPRPQPLRMARPLRSAPRRIPAPDRPGRSSGLRLPSRRGRSLAVGSGRWPRRAGAAAGGRRRRGAAPGVAPAVRRRIRAGAPAGRSRRHPAGEPIHQLAAGCRGPLRQEALDKLGRLQGPRH